MKLTRESIEAGKTDNGGWTGEQMRVLGVEWPPTKGWTHRLIGKEVSEEVYATFLDLRLSRVRRKIGAPKRPPKEHAELFADDASPESFANNLFTARGGDLA